MIIYRNTFKEYTVWDVYNDFRDMYHAYPKVFNDLYEVESTKIKQISLEFLPIEVIAKPIVKLYPDRANYEAGTNAVILTEWVDYHLDYDMGILMLTWTHPLVVGNLIETIGQYNIINFRQFINHLNKALRIMNRQYPINDFFEYKQDQDGNTTISKLDLTDPAIPFISTNDVYSKIDDEVWIPFIRRGKYLIFTSGNWSIWTIDDYYDSTPEISVDIDLPVFLQWNLSPQRIEWATDWNVTKSKSFKFAEEWYDALLVFIWLEMYKTRLRYSAEINLFTLRLNEKGIISLIYSLSDELKNYGYTTNISHWSYASSSTPKTFTLTEAT